MKDSSHRSQKRAKNQHYVPQMLLKNFSFGKKKSPKIYIFDKQRGGIGGSLPGPQAVKNIASESGFYDLKDGDIRVSLEESLSVLEDNAAKVFQRILETRDLARLSDNDRGWVYIFVAYQFARGKYVREIAKYIDDALVKQIIATGGDPKNVKGYHPFDSEEEIKEFAMRFMAKSAPQIANTIASKNWMLFEAPRDCPFFVGDNPVVLHNDTNFGPYGKLGFAVPDIQIYLPLSSWLTLGFWCPRMVASIVSQYEECKKTLSHLVAMRTMLMNINRYAMGKAIDGYRNQLSFSEAVVEGIKTGKPISCIEDNVTFMNSLQVQWASRFVMSRENNFTLVERMLRDNPNYRFSLKPKVN